MKCSGLRINILDKHISLNKELISKINTKYIQIGVDKEIIAIKQVNFANKGYRIYCCSQYARIHINQTLRKWLDKYNITGEYLLEYDTEDNLYYSIRKES